jgi:hypothetical protein
MTGNMRRRVLSRIRLLSLLLMRILMARYDVPLVLKMCWRRQALMCRMRMMLSTDMLADSNDKFKREGSCETEYEKDEGSLMGVEDILIASGLMSSTSQANSRA